MNTSLTMKVLSGALLALATCVTHADAVPNNSIYAGAYFLSFKPTSPGLQGPFTVPGLNASVDNVTTTYLAYLRRLSPNFDLELAAGIPPTTTVVGQGPASVGSVPYNGQKLITAKWLSPTLLLNYKFFSEDTALRPYVGIGINHTIFYDRTVTAAGQAVTGGPTSVSLSPSTGGAAVVGLSYRLQDRWFAHASYSVSNIHTSAVADTAGIVRTTHLDFGPRSVVLAVGYTF